jgi:hypothetical protein
MPKSVLPKFSFLAVVLVSAVLSLGFTRHMDEQEMLAWGNKCLNESFDPTVDAKLKKWQIELTPEAFLRIRKTYQSKKEEYFSLQLHRMVDVNYLGTPESGTLQLKAAEDDIIVQVTHDRKGDLDTLATMLSIPVKNMPTERLDSLRTVLEYFKEKEF